MPKIKWILRANTGFTEVFREYNKIIYYTTKLKKFKNILPSVDINFQWVYNIFIKLIKLFKLIKRHIFLIYVIKQIIGCTVRAIISTN